MFGIPRRHMVETMNQGPEKDTASDNSSHASAVGGTTIAKPPQSDRKPSGTRSNTLRRWIPNQPGAWAMALMPPLAGTLMGGVSWRNLLLLLAWVLCYCTEFTTARWLTSRMSKRFLPPVAAYAAVTAVFGLALLVTTPGLLRWVPLYMVLAALTFLAAWRRVERSWWNNLVSIIAACTLCLIAYSLGSGPQSQATHSPDVYFGCPPNPAVNCFSEGLFPAQAFPPVGLVATLIFAYTEFGSVLYVKSLVRERKHLWCTVASVVWNLMLTIGAALVLPEVGFWPLFAALILVIRAAALPAIARRHRIPIKQVGMVESIASLVVFLVTIGTAGPITSTLQGVGLFL